MQTYPALSGKKEAVIRLDNLRVALQDAAILQNLLRRESLCDGYLHMAAKYGKTPSKPVQASPNELKKFRAHRDGAAREYRKAHLIAR